MGNMEDYNYIIWSVGTTIVVSVFFLLLLSGHRLEISFLLLILLIMYLACKIINKFKATHLKTLLDNYQKYFIDCVDMRSFADLFFIEQITSNNRKYTLKYINAQVINSIKRTLLEKYLHDNDYIQPILRKQKQLVYTDDYGDIIEEDFFREITRFIIKKREYINKYIYQNLPKYFSDLIITGDTGEYTGFDLVRDDYNDYDIRQYIVINMIINQILPKHTLEDHYHFVPDDPYEYEQYVADIFSSCGWNVRVTSKSGDQGADIIAEQNSCKAVIQCKLYSNAVGNSAIQEVSSAREFYCANIAIVVTNNSFTKSARQLAQVQNVYLLHDSQITEFTNNLFYNT